MANLINNTELKDIINKSDRYKNFTILNKPVPFDDLMKDKNFDVVQTHSTQIIEIDENTKDIIGFCGQFSWKNNEIKPLDGDSYNPHMTVYGYDDWSNECSTNGLDILVGEDW